jgi:Family of unknown function (DUF5318)
MGFLPVDAADALTEGEIDYRLARQSVLRRYREGELSRHDVCDAHPELIRAGLEYSTPVAQTCPVCEAHQLAHVSYVFGPRLPSHGRCVNSDAELERIRKRKGAFTCYVVEVCTGCRWNHLRSAYLL